MRHICNKIIHRIFLGAALLLPFFFILPSYSSFEIPKNSLLIMCSLLLFFFFALWFSHKKDEIVVYFKREFLYLAAFIGYMLLSVFFSSDISTGFKQFLPFFAVFIFFVVFVIFYRNEDPLNHRQFELIQVIVYAGALQALVALLQFFGIAFEFFADASGKWRVFGTMGNPNYVAEFLLPTAFLALNMLNNEKRPLRCSLYRSCLVIIMLGIFATFSRSGMLLLFGGMVLYLVYFVKTSTHSIKEYLAQIFKRGKSVLIPTMIGFILIVIVAPLMRFDKAVIRHVTNRASIVGRVFIWKNSVNAALRNLPFGAGIGDFRKVYTESQYNHFADGSSQFVNNAWQIGKAHNDLLQLFVELGLGAVPFLLFLFFIVRMGSSSLRHDDFSIGIFVAFVALLASSLLNFPLRVAPNLFMFFLLAAFIYRHRTIPGSLKKIILNKRPAHYFAYLVLPLLLLLAQFPVRTSIAHYYLQQGVEAEANGWKKQAMRYYKKANSIDGSLAPALIGMAKYLHQSGNGSAAESLLKDSLKIAPLPEALRLLAQTKKQQGKFDEYVQYLKKRAYSFRKIVPYQVDYIKALFQAGKFKQVVRETKFANRTAIAVSPFPYSWLQKIEQANGQALFAKMKLAAKVIRYAGMGGYTALTQTDKYVYAGTMGSGIVRLDPRSGKIIATDSPGYFITALKYGRGNFWAGTERGLFRRAKGTTRWVHIELPKLGNQKITTISIGHEYVWVATSSYIYQRAHQSTGWRLYRSVGRKLFDGIRCSSVYKNRVYFGAVGQVIVWQRGKGMRVAPVSLPRFLFRNKKPLLVNSVYPFSEKLIGLCTSAGLVTYFVPGKAAVKLDFARQNLLGANIFEKSIVVLTSSGRLLLKDLRQLFTQINRDILSRASMRFTFQLIRRNYDNLVPALKKNLSEERLLVYNSARVRDLLCAATARGLLLQAGPWGAPHFKGNNSALPSPMPLAMAALDKTLFLADQESVWRYSNGKFLRVMAVQDVIGFKKSGKNLYFAAGNTLYLVTNNGLRPIVRGAGKITSFNASSAMIAIVSKRGMLSLYTAQGRLMLRRLIKEEVLSCAVGDRYLYLGTRLSGVIVYDIKQGLKEVRRLDRLSGSPDNQISALLFADGHLWIGTARAGIAIFEPNSGSLKRQTIRRDFFVPPVSALYHIAPHKVMAIQGAQLSFLSADMRRGIYFDSPVDWPMLLADVTLCDGALFVSGAGGVFRYAGFSSLFSQYDTYFRTAHE